MVDWLNLEMAIPISQSFHSALTRNSFWNSVNILLAKPHVVNKRLWGSKIWFRYNCRSNCLPWDLPTTCQFLENTVTDDNVKSQVSNIFNQLAICSDETSVAETVIEVILVELLPKAYTYSQAYQLICLQKDKCIITFYNVTPTSFEQNLCPNFTYSIQLVQNEVVMTAFDG